MNKKRQKLVRKLQNKEYRDAWVDESIKTIVPFQIQAIRTKKDWTQAMLGEKSQMLPNAITRIESPEYGNLSINTLLRVAHGFDCGLLVKFVPFSRMVHEFKDVSPRGLEVKDFLEDADNLQSWVDESDEPIQASLTGGDYKSAPIPDSYRQFLNWKPERPEDSERLDETGAGQMRITPTTATTAELMTTV